MFIDFTVENYRSIKEPVTLSAVAQTHGSNEQDNKIAEPYSYPARKLEILPVLGIFGANASGKSNVINAIGEMLTHVSFNAFPPHLYKGFLLPYKELNFVTPFKLKGETSEAPSKFRVRVLGDGNIYIFELSLNRNQILRERMEYIPRKSKRSVSRLLFDRIWDDESKKYSVKNGSDFGETYREIQLSIKESQTFLSFLLNNLKVELLEPLTSWWENYWGSVSLHEDTWDYQISCAALRQDNSELLDKVKTILQKFDTGIDDIEIKSVADINKGPVDYEVWITHNINERKTVWQLNEESLGTQKLFKLAAKLFYTLEQGGLMLVDELGFGTHPKINREIVRLFQDRSINENGAQLIFTSHDSTLLSKGILRRDQIWFTQKREDGSTELYSLADFGVRNDLVIDKAYLDGRFGAVPFLPDKEELTELLGV